MKSIKKTMKQLDSIPMPEFPEYARAKDSGNRSRIPQIAAGLAALAVITGGVYAYFKINTAPSIPITPEMPEKLETATMIAALSEEDYDIDGWIIPETEHIIPDENAKMKYVDGWAFENEEGVRYSSEVFWNEDYTYLEESVFTKYKYDEIVWQVKFDGYYGVYEFAEYGGDTVIAGEQCIGYGGESAMTYCRFISLIDPSGNVLWEKTTEAEEEYQRYDELIVGKDGITAFGIKNRKIICDKYDFNGNLLESSEVSTNETDYGYIVNAASSEDDWAVLLTHDVIVKKDMCRVFGADDKLFWFNGLAYYNNKLYISGYYSPVIEGEWGGRNDIAALLNYITEKGWESEIDKEELTEIARKNFTAVLLVCDPETLVPESFYEISGASGLDLTADENGLVWNAADIADVIFSPMTDSFTFESNGYIYEHQFDEYGFVGSEKTEYKSGFWR